MKKTTFLLLALLTLPVFLNASEGTVASTIVTVQLSGDYPVGPARSLRPSVRVEQSAGQLEAIFMANLGSVTIGVQNAAGTVMCQTAVSTPVTRNVVVNTVTWPAGDYQIIIALATGQQLTGEFTL